MASPGNQRCACCTGTLTFPTRSTVLIFTCGFVGVAETGIIKSLLNDEVLRIYFSHSVGWATGRASGL